MQLKRPPDPVSWLDTMAQENIRTETVLQHFHKNTGITWDILRADLLHPVCSGNKFFKLKYHLLDAIQKKHTTIVTAGGAWSNHIVATAYAARACQLRSIGIIRGEKPARPSDTLKEADALGMTLDFVSRSDYPSSADRYPGQYFIPAGGYGELGARGAGDMLQHARIETYTHILCAVGTGTMLAGLALTAGTQQVIGIPVLKHGQIGSEVAALAHRNNIALLHQFHHGGYAKTSSELLSFMNRFYEATGIPTDFVYTGKLMYAIAQLIQDQYFPPGSRILTIHSGGIQGNKSLKKGALAF